LAQSEGRSWHEQSDDSTRIPFRCARRSGAGDGILRANAKRCKTLQITAKLRKIRQISARLLPLCVQNPLWRRLAEYDASDTSNFSRLQLAAVDPSSTVCGGEAAARRACRKPQRAPAWAIQREDTKRSRRAPGGDPE